jgi:hypothetical protein
MSIWASKASKRWSRRREIPGGGAEVRPRRRLSDLVQHQLEPTSTRASMRKSDFAPNLVQSAGSRHDDAIAAFRGRVDLVQPHRPLAARADHDVDSEHSLKEPRPRVTARWLGAQLELGRLALEQLQLRRLGKLGRATGDDFAACLGMSREHAVVAQQVEARRRDQGDEPSDEVERVEQHGMRAVTPSSLESMQQTLAIGRELEALRDRRPRDVPTQPLESATISAVDHRARVHVQTTDVEATRRPRRGTPSPCESAACRRSARRPPRPRSTETARAPACASRR